MKYDEPEQETTFESTGTKVYSHGGFNDVWFDGDRVGLSYGSDGGEEVEPEEALEFIDHHIRALMDARTKITNEIIRERDRAINEAAYATNPEDE